MALTTLQTQLYIPRLRTNLAPRHTLAAPLMIDALPALTLISAPAGFGKTTLASGWCAALTAQATTTEPICCWPALVHLERFVQEAQATGHGTLLIKALVLQSHTLYKAGACDKTLATIEHALRLAAPEGYVSAFVEGGTAIAALICAVQIPHKEVALVHYKERLLTAFAHLDNSPTHAELLDLANRPSASRAVSRQAIVAQLLEPLSDRELEILRLVADGLSNNAIAEQLIVTVGTIKKHLNNIYGKLGVGSRTQAIAQVRELKLL